MDSVVVLVIGFVIKDEVINDGDVEDFSFILVESVTGNIGLVLLNLAKIIFLSDLFKKVGRGLLLPIAIKQLMARMTKITSVVLLMFCLALSNSKK